MAAAAPLSRPVTKKAIKHTATPPPSMHRAKRPRTSEPQPDLADLKAQAGAAKRSNSGGATLTLSAASAMAVGGDMSAYTKSMYLAFINDALEKRAKGDNVRYLELVGQFRSLLPSADAVPSKPSSTTRPPPTPAQRRLWLETLTHIVSKLDKSHAPLVETIIDVPWATMEDAFVAAYVRFIGALVSARTEWLKPVLEKCVRGFKYRSNYTSGSSNALPTLTRRTLYGRLHSLLRMLITLIPTLSSSLSPLLASHFPSKREPRTAQICYIDNLLAITDYCPALVEDILTLVIERALHIDVDIQGEPEEWEDVEEELLAEGQMPLIQSVRDVVDRPTALDEDDDSSDDDEEGGLDLDDLDSDDEPDPTSDAEAERIAKAQGMSDAAIRRSLENRGKLDAILKVVLDHLAVAHGRKVPAEPVADSNGAESKEKDEEETTPTPEEPVSPESLERRRTLFNTVLDIFDRTLLRTFKTRNTQFILFYLCSLNITSSDHFVGVLVARALHEVEAPDVTRVAAAGYIASFVSRASFIDTVMTRRVVKHLCHFLEGQMEDQANGLGGNQHLPVFYAVAQAVFYIFCFRWKDLVDEADDDEIVLDSGRRWMMGLETIKKLVSSSYNPLKICADPVVNQFAHMAHKTNFLYCHNIVEANRRISSRESYPAPSQMPSSLGAKAAIVSNVASTPRQLLVAREMDSFFPFDPFKLPLSSVYIEDIYRVWEEDDGSASEASSTDSDDEDESSDAEELSDDEGAVSGGLAVPGARFGKRQEEDDAVARSFEAMSLSPDRSAFGGRVGSLPMPSLIL